MRRRRVALVAALVVAPVLVAAPAVAAWLTSGTGSATAAATSLGRPSASTSVTTTSVTVSPAPGTGAPVDTYTISRVEPPATICVTSGTPCPDPSRSAGTAYTYTVVPARGAWTGPAATVAATTSALPTAPADSTPPALTLGTCGASSTPNPNAVGCSGGSYGRATGDVQTVTVVFCAVREAPGPCSAANVKETITATLNPANGTWSATSGTIGNKSVRYAEVVQRDEVGNVARTWSSELIA